MANTAVFKTTRGRTPEPADTRNRAGGLAYKLEDTHALAQYACTGCFNGTFYTRPENQLEEVLSLCSKVDPEFIAKTAVYAREKGYMKDMPAFLAAYLTMNGGEHLERVFQRVINNGKMLRNFVQIVRSGVVGRKSLGSRPKRLVRQWLAGRTDEQLFRDSVGNDPSLADVIKMVHPIPAQEQEGERIRERAALYNYLIGKGEWDAVCALVKEYEAYKATREGTPPNVPFQMLDSLDIGQAEWTEIARNAPWHMTRMNLRTFARHGVFQNREVTDLVAERLANAEIVRKVNVFPYQLMMAYTMASQDDKVPHKVREALQDAMEIALENVPQIKGEIVVCPDVSGSMGSPVTGYRKGSSSAVRCVDVASLFASAMLRTNKSARVLPFAHTLYANVQVNPRDSVMTNTRKFSACFGGGTNCSLPLQRLNTEGAKVDTVVFISDYESWMDRQNYWGGSNATGMQSEWNKLKSRNPNAKLVCIDITPTGDTQTKERKDVLNIGGFSDQVFEIVSEFANDTLTPEHWVGKINEVEI